MENYTCHVSDTRGTPEVTLVFRGQLKNVALATFGVSRTAQSSYSSPTGQPDYERGWKIIEGGLPSDITLEEAKKMVADAYEQSPLRVKYR